MAEQYLKVLAALNCRVNVVGRNREKAIALANRYGAEGFGGGADVLKKIDTQKADLVIVATSVDSIKEVSIACLDNGIKNILAEKPGAVNLSELKEIKEKITPAVNFRIAYNRRFYNSVRILRSRLLDGEGAMGCCFEFTELEKIILNWKGTKRLLRRLGFLNSSHVIDAAFFLIGMPVELTPLRDRFLEGHPSGSIFSGCGRTDACLFCYIATWGGGGRWGIDVSTKRGKYRLCPLEELSFCKKDSFSWEVIAPEDNDDQRFKPGLYKMVRHSLFREEPCLLPDIADQIKMCETADKIFYYED